jgi:hypothetical protein
MPCISRLISVALKFGISADFSWMKWEIRNELDGGAVKFCGESLGALKFWSDRPSSSQPGGKFVCLL